MVDAATELARFTSQHLIAPAGNPVSGLLEQIFAGLRDRRTRCIPSRF
jgi:hypothetical protein